MKKLLSLLLALCLVLTVLPVSALAAAPKEELSGMMVPSTVGELENASVEPNAKSYSVKLTGEGSGEVELLVDSPAQAGSEVYFMANPDDGYPAHVYYQGLDGDDLVYVGADIIGFIMPSNAVTLNVKFVKAEGSENLIFVNEYGSGQYALSRNKACEYESVLLAVLPDNDSEFDPYTHVDINEGVLFYLLEEDGIYYYEIIMPDIPVSLAVAYGRVGPSDVEVMHAPKATVSWTPKNPYFLDTVTVTIIPEPGYQVDSAEAVSSSMGPGIYTALESIGNNQYTFTMPAGDVYLEINTEPIPYNVKVQSGTGGTASVDLKQAYVGNTVTLTCKPDAGYRVASITGAPKLTDKGNGVYTFKMPAKKVNISVLFLREDNPFLDVNETHFFYESVIWAVEKGITNGVSETLFGPMYATNRAAVVTMLWRYADCPEPETTEHPFTDVPAGSWYEKAVLWAVENGITNGISATEFGPNGACNRVQVVTFLYRAVMAQ